MEHHYDAIDARKQKLTPPNIAICLDTKHVTGIEQSTLEESFPWLRNCP